MANNKYDNETYKHSCSLLSIEYIRVNKIDDGIELVPGQHLIYGTVIVTDWGDSIVYHRPSFKPERKGPGEYLSLTGPSRAISGDYEVVITVHLRVKLWDHDGTETTKEIAKGEVVWHWRYYTLYDKSLEKDVLGKHGSVTVGYSVIKQALFATINVAMMNESPSPVAQIYRTIKAYRFLEEGSSSTTRMLFDKSENECVEVNPQQQSIPLTRPFFPVPVHSSLTIEADLWDHHTLSSDDEQIVLGSVQFTPIFGTQKKNITGKYGGMQVSITFDEG